MKSFIVALALGLSAAKPSPFTWDKRPPPSLWAKRPPASIQNRSPPFFQQVATSSAVPFEAAPAQSRAVIPCGWWGLPAGSYTIKSPNHPQNYPNNFDCTYRLSPIAGATSLSISCSAFNIEQHSTCDWDWLSVNGRYKFCGTSGPRGYASSLNINFHSDYSVVRTGYLCTIVARAGSTGGCSCGVANRAARVVGGQETGANEYPWQAGLVLTGGTRTFCGGSLINDRYVLTAAHCLNGKIESQIQVLLGEHRIGVADGESRHNVAQIIRDPAYTSFANGHDFALLKLSVPVAFNARRRPVCLPTAGNTYAGASAVVTGFGRTGTTEPQATTLQELAVSVLSDSQCDRFWGSHSTTTICAGGLPQGGQAFCRGDSGGPLITLENGRYAVIGVVSYFSSLGCAYPNAPDVYARVTEVLPWIRANTADATYCS